MSLDSPNNFVKDPDAKLDYTVDWTSWLGSDTIASVSWTVPSGITNVSTSNTTKTATIWLSDGTVGKSYNIACKITTTATRIDERTITISVRQK